MPEQPLVSIIIPTYNRAHLIGETIDSVLAQTYANWECIVIDDGSTDNTLEVLERYASKDKRIQYFCRPTTLNKGGNVCRNYGFNLSNGDFIQWLDSDDLLDKDKLKLQLATFKYDHTVCLTTCKFGYFSDIQNTCVRDKVVTYCNYAHGLELLETYGKYMEYFPIHAFLTKRDIVEAAGLWNETIEINQDGEFFARVLLASDKIIFVDTAVYYRKTKSENVSVVTNVDKAEKLIACWSLIERHVLEKTNERRHVYTEMAKRLVYNKIKGHYPDLVKKHYSFFKSILPFYKKILNM